MTKDVNSTGEHLSILVVDDTRLHAVMLSQFVTTLGHHSVIACSGDEAIALFTAQRFDIVLMDIIMPGMGGIEAARRMKEISANRWVPIFFISGLADNVDFAIGLNQGGDDYISKPINFLILEAKLNAVRRLVRAQRLLEHSNSELQQYRDQAESENEIAKFLISRYIRTEKLSDPLLQWWIQPASGFSGDIVAAARNNLGHLHLILADATGHGLTAAISLIPVAQAFYTMTAKGFDLGDVVTEINKQVYNFNPRDRFVALTFVSIKPRDREIEVWNGGGPTAWYIEGNRPEHSFDSINVPVGILSPTEFEAKPEVYHWKEDGQLLIFSDGAAEATAKNGDMVGTAALLESAVAVEPAHRLEAIKARITAHLNGQEAHDDISVVVMDCKHEDISELHDGESKPDVVTVDIDEDWGMSFTIGAKLIERDRPVQNTVQRIRGMGLSEDVCNRVQLILSELCINAVDHGILGLDSKIKQSGPDGFDLYMEERQRRLDSLQHARLKVSIDAFLAGDDKYLRINIEDSGAGFDFQRYLEPSIELNENFSGRGIALVKSLSRKLEYHGKGNSVTAEMAIVAH
ncbi:ATP-binding SpoIIE family protein phosphatase [Ampullimonas aquatilis]|uniref:ATP-binding SpoIIE family protein phosphatase n=1 Tax=Ampullimonas aquatilis TaxID=1341549 RepID=UPI003C7708C2